MPRSDISKVALRVSRSILHVFANVLFYLIVVVIIIRACGYVYDFSYQVFGSVPKQESVELLSGDSIEKGVKVVFAAEPVEGYRVKNWIVNDVVQMGETGEEFSYIINGPVEIAVEIERSARPSSDPNVNKAYAWIRQENSAAGNYVVEFLESERGGMSAIKYGYDIEIQILPEESVSNVSKKLETKGIINDYKSFKVKAILKEYKTVPGTFILNTSMDYSEILDTIENSANSIVEVELPEPEEVDDAS